MERLFTLSMKKILKVLTARIFLILSMLFNYSCQAQRPGTETLIKAPEFNKKLNSLLNFNVPVIGVDELAANYSSYIVLDAREQAEYKISHLKDAKNIGYDKPDFSVLQHIPKDSRIVIYCSVGYRSEKLGKKLTEMGFRNVKNLYGSIFEWVNRGNPVYDIHGVKSSKIHTYNKDWSKWVTNSSMKKMW